MKRTNIINKLGKKVEEKGYSLISQFEAKPSREVQNFDEIHDKALEQFNSDGIPRMIIYISGFSIVEIFGLVNLIKVDYFNAGSKIPRLFVLYNMKDRTFQLVGDNSKISLTKYSQDLIHALARHIHDAYLAKKLPC